MTARWVGEQHYVGISIVLTTAAQVGGLRKHWGVQRISEYGLEGRSIETFFDLYAADEDQNLGSEIASIRASSDFGHRPDRPNREAC
jgi:hypothetical protein